MILSWKNNGSFATASDRPAYGHRHPARFARLFPALEGLCAPVKDAPWVRPAYRRRAIVLRKLLRWLLAVTAVITVVLVVHSTMLRVNGAVVLARHEIPGMPVFFCQEDAAWAGDQLGASGKTLGEAGDSVTCLASLIEMQQLPTPIEGALNPGTVNAWLSENGAYDARGRLNWSKAAKLLGVNLVDRQPGWGVGGTLEWLLQREVYAVARVKRPDTGTFHDVLVVGTVHGEFVIMDPLDPTGIPNSLSLYGNRIYAVKYLK